MAASAGMTISAGPRSTPMIRLATPPDADGICRIYNHFVTTTVVSFEEVPVPVADMAARISGLVRTHPWYVAEEAGVVVGYAYAGPWRTRAAYRHAVESTIYVAPGRSGQGIGSTLYTRLIDELRRREFHCVIGGIALPNAASVALHEAMGFTKVAHFREVGWKLGRRVDVGYWQIML
jgi:phosphinothricin acetyltransferase